MMQSGDRLPGDDKWREQVLRVGCIILGVTTVFSATWYFVLFGFTIIFVYLASVVILSCLIFIFSSRFRTIGSFFLNGLVFACTLYFTPANLLLNTASGTSLIIPICLLGITTRFRYALIMAITSIVMFVIIAIKAGQPWTSNTTPSIVIIVIMTMLLYFVERQQETIQRQNRELQLVHAQLTAFALAEERTRIARDIHDSLGSHLMSIVNLLKGARQTHGTDPSRTIELIQGSLDVAAEAMADVREAVTALRDSPYERRPLYEIMSTLATNTDGCSTAVTQSGEPYDLPLPMLTAISRIVQEAMTNVRKHASATQVVIELDYRDPEVFSFQVIDNGNGATHINGGYGLIGIRERVASFAGQVEYHTAPGAGFRLHVRIPV